MTLYYRYDSILITRYCLFPEIVLLAERGSLKELEKRFKSGPKPEMTYIEEAMLMAIQKGNDDCVPLLVVAGARRLDCALYLAIQLGRIKAIATLLLCKATITGDTSAIRSLLSEPPESANVLWYMPKVHKFLSEGNIKMSYPIAVSIFEKKYEATKELLLRTDLDMGRKQVDWSKLKLTLLDSSWMYSIAPWVVSLKLVNNHLRKLPREMFSATQLRRLDLSQNILENVSADLIALPNLEYLSLGHNRLKDLPETANWSRSLLSLDLSDNLLTTLPQGIQHSCIEILNLSKNQFHVVPKCLCQVRTLTSLDLSSMPISTLPKEMEYLDHLVNLNVSNMNINDLPNGGGILRGGIRGIFRAHARTNKSCNHVKLMLLCHSDTIKTVMLSRLKPNFNVSQFPPNQPLPEVDVFQWSFKPLFTRKVFVSPKLYFNTWLIGSHYSCRSIYPCFFTTSALYVIVWDETITADLRERIKAYIDLLVRYVPSANILVIAVLPEQYEGWNIEKQKETLVLRLNNFFSKPSYKSLCFHGILIVIANPNVKVGQADLKQRLYDTAQQMVINKQPLVGRQVPETYFSLIPVLEREQQTFRSQSKPGVLEESAIWTLFDQALSSDPPDRMELPVMVEFLTEAGFLLHYEDPNDRLDQCYFTRPVWLYNTLLRVVHHAMEHRSRLFISHKELCSLANVSWSKDISQALIRLMIRYSIALPTAKDEYLLTCLLPHSTPPSDVLYCGMLRRQFAPKQRSLPIDLWSRLLSSVITNLPRITNVSEMKKRKRKEDEDTDDETDQHGLTSVKKTQHRLHPNMYDKKEQENSLSQPSSDATALTMIKKAEDRSENEMKSQQVEETVAASVEAVSETMMGLSSKSKTGEPEKRVEQVDEEFELIVDQDVTPQSSDSLQQTSLAIGSALRSPLKENLLIAIDDGVEIWDCGIIYNKEGVKFSIFPCVSEVSTVEERGIEICCTRDSYGYVIMARLCWLVQKNLEDRFPRLFSTDTPLQKHELTQIAICPTCLERNERNPSCFLIEACVHALQRKNEHNCRNHPESIPLRDLVPDYLLLDFPSDLHLTKEMFEYNEAKPLHRGRQAFLHDGQLRERKVAVKVFHQVDSRSITLPLSCVRKETDMLSSLKHPNIVKIFGFCLDPACVLLEKAPLGNLYQKLMDTEKKISRTVRFHISCQIASALSYLHRRHIVYRTLKASSVLLWSLDFNCDASVKLANFERAAYQSPSGLMGKTNFSSYPAPEMLRYSFREEYTEKVDIYSFGILLYELVTRWQPYGGTYNGNHSQKPKLSGVVTTSYSTIVKLMEECWLEESMARPSADHLLLQLSEPSFQCHIASQVLRDCVSVRGCCFVPSVRQIWVYGEYIKTSVSREGEVLEGTQVFILNAENLTVQGSLELKERATAISTVDNKVWIGMTELCVHAYDTTTFRFTDRFHLDDSATVITDNDCYVFVGQANGHLKCYSKLDLQRGDNKAVNVHIGDKAIIAMVTVGDVIWVGCGDELVIVAAEDDVIIESIFRACESTDQVCGLTVSRSTNTVWCFTMGSHSITSWDIHTTQHKHTIDLSEELKWVCRELNYDPSFIRVVSLECVSDTLWVGLSCGVIMILTDTEEPKEIVHFKAHRRAIECLLKIPHSDELHQHHDHPVILSGGYGEVSTLASATSEQNGVVMLWHAFTANEFSTVSKRHNKYSSTNV